MVDRLVGSEVNSRRIGTIESCFGKSGQTLAVPGRVLVGEGVLIKMCRKKPKPRQFFLFNDILVYGTILLAKRKYNKQQCIPLEDVQIEDTPDVEDLRNGFVVKTRAKSFAVYAGTANEKHEWMVHINRCINELLAKSGKTPARDHAAVWVPDVEAKTCMLCAYTFGVVNRRHHCRNCGKVVCASCSNHRALVPSINDKTPKRVCSTCFDRLTSRADNTGDDARYSHVSISSHIANDGDSSSEEEEENTANGMGDDQTPTFYGGTPKQQ